MGTPDPRYTLRTEWPEVKVYARWMPDRWALTTWTDSGAYIELALDLGAEQQLFSLAHELGHLTLGAPCRSFCERNEREVVAWTARYLIPDVKPLAELLAKHDIAGAADALGLPPEAVYDRLACMTAYEQDQMAALVPAVRAATGRMSAYPRRPAGRPHHCERGSQCEPPSSSPQEPPA